MNEIKEKIINFKSIVGNSTIQSNLSNLQLELLKLYAKFVNDEELLGNKTITI
ncbi:MAG: hypothetical protein R2801_07320 [Chitinophagales bacterium]